MSEQWTPADSDFEMRVRRSFDRQPMMKTLGVEIEGVLPGEVRFSMPHGPEFTQQHGFLHAGTVAAVLDSACGYAAFSLMPPEAAILTVNNTLNLLAPASAERYLAEARVIKTGRTISVADAMLLDQSDESKPIATMTATLMALYDRGIHQ